MKKIISLVAAIAMAATMATSFVTVSAATLNIGIDTTVTPMSAAEFNDFMGEPLPDGETAYVAAFSLKNFGELDCTVSARKHSGRKMSVASIEMPTLGNIANKSYTMTMSNAFTNALSEGFDGAKFSTSFGSAAASTSYPTAKASGITTIENAFELLIVVPNGTSATIDYSFNGLITNYTSDVAGEADDMLGEGQFTIGTPAPAAKLDKVEITGATSTDLTVGDQVTLTAKAYNDDNTENAAAITWTVDGDAVSVADGVVKAEKAGTATVKATAKDGDIEKTASVDFTVAAAPIPELEITINGATGDVAGIEVKEGENLLGYIWKVLLKNYKAGTYTATFKAGEDTKTATISGMPDVEGNPNVSFAVILNTVKENVTLGVTHAE